MPYNTIPYSFLSYPTLPCPVLPSSFSTSYPTLLHSTLIHSLLLSTSYFSTHLRDYHLLSYPLPSLHLHNFLFFLSFHLLIHHNYQPLLPFSSPLISFPLHSSPLPHALNYQHPSLIFSCSLPFFVLSIHPNFLISLTFLSYEIRHFFQYLFNLIQFISMWKQFHLLRYFFFRLHL